MCGRYSIAADREALRRRFACLSFEGEVRPRYNAAPAQHLPIVRLNRSGQRELALLRWGLVPSWAVDPGTGSSNINAQAETVHRMPAFRTSFRRRRCLVPADGFYKWRVSSDGKQPYRFALKDGAPFAMAGLWERWDRGGETIESFAIIVGIANDSVRPVHDRMPVILDPSTWSEWLETEGTTIPMALLQFHPTADMAVYPVSRRVDDRNNDDLDVIAPLSA
jgi:putative SOS response-associated peptidase YedK